jgi:uncharacterized surface protein with fasciclin (FAS1) repeats
MVGRELSLVPSFFSTLLLAYEKTKFVDFIHNVHMEGSTVFVPSNGAFTKLGVRANAFLFNTELGLKYLHALLKYQIVANTTLYSDAIYNSDTEQVANYEESATTGERFLIELPTLLGDKSITVSVAHFLGFIRMKVNGYVKVGVQDVIAKNGVIQIVDAVPLPRHKHGKEHDGGEIEVEDLMERLEGYVDGNGAATHHDWIGEL